VDIVKYFVVKKINAAPAEPKKDLKKYPSDLIACVQHQFRAGLTIIRPPAAGSDSNRVGTSHCLWNLHDLTFLFQLDYYYLKQVHIFIPELFDNDFGRLSCPYCSNPKVRFKDYGTRTVILQHTTATLLGRRYYCKECQKHPRNRRTNSLTNSGTGESDDDDDDSNDTNGHASFYSWNKVLLEQSPSFIRDTFPYILTKRLGILRSIAHEVLDSAVSGRSASAVAHSLQQNHKHHFHQMEKRFYSLESALVRSDRQHQLNPTSFSTFENPNGYHGRIVSDSYLLSLIPKLFKEAIYSVDALNGHENITREEFLQRQLQNIGGTILKIDKSFKITNLTQIRESTKTKPQQHSSKSKSEKPFTSLLTIMNEHNQVVFQSPLTSYSREEIKGKLKQLFLHRYRRRGFPRPGAIFSDRCCFEAKLLKDVFDELSKEDALFSGKLDAESPNSIEPLPPLELLTSEAVPVINWNDTPKLSYCVAKLREASESNGGIIGFDIEWNAPYLHGQLDSAPALLQLCAGPDTIFLIRLIAPGTGINTRVSSKPLHGLPQLLTDLLYDTRLTFVGCNIGGDITCLKNAYKVDAERVNVCNLITEARRRNYKLERMGLADMVRFFLKRNLSKNHDIRLSNWTERQLSPLQCMYAALDAFASYEVYQKMVNSSDPRYNSPPTELLAGTQVLIFSKSNAFCVARGLVASYVGDKYGSYQLSTKLTMRVVVEVEKDGVFIPGAMILYPWLGKKGQSLPKFGELLSGSARKCDLLWDMENLRHCVWQLREH
jgi:hypothetical protein